MTLVLATRNLHKVREIGELLWEEVVPLPDDVILPPETGDTFEENALIKARAAAAALGTPVMADDSGIQAEALGGRPGVYSARYAGPNATDAQNLAKFIDEVPVGSLLMYVCVIAYVNPSMPDRFREYTFKGCCTGRMAAEPRGQNGFGYDPIFIPDEYPDDRTMAELSPEKKNRISHRRKALEKYIVRMGD